MGTNPPPRSASARVAALVGALVLGGVVLAIYGTAVHAPFFFDDLHTVVKNPSIRRVWPVIDLSDRGGPLTPPKGIPTSARPVVNLSLALNYYFGALDPTGYHLVNMILHALAACTLWAIVYRTLRLGYFQHRFDRVAGYLSFASALVWAAHPVNTESVNYVTQRTELMMGWFYLLTLFASLRYWSATAPAWRALWLSVATMACLLGMLSKEVMASAPVVVLLFERTFITGSFRRALRASWPLYLGLAAAWIPLLCIYLSGHHTPEAGFGLPVRAVPWWLTQAKVLILYLKLTFWPWPLLIQYELPYFETLAAAWPWLLAAAALGLVALVLVWRRTAAGFVGASVLMVLSPTFLIPMTNEVAAERRMYLPLAAIAPLVVAGGYALAERVARSIDARTERRLAGWGPIAVTGVGVVVVGAVFGLLSLRRSNVYNDELDLWRDAAVHQPDNFMACYNAGTLLAVAGRQQEAIEQFEAALRRKPDSSDAHFNLARALDEVGRQREAFGHYQEAVRLKPDFAAAHYNLGIALTQAGRIGAGIDHFQRAVELEPDFADAHMNLGSALASIGRIEDAIAHFERAVALKPDGVALANLAFAYAMAQRDAEAIATAERALELARSEGDASLAAQLEAWMLQQRRRAPRP
ncbi:MAG: tetratricopeptide repeat protein [Planctomycetia bacterium]|nr:tetratricopeptide repeat protein [Planctomycetia bacterium]